MGRAQHSLAPDIGITAGERSNHHSGSRRRAGMGDALQHFYLRYSGQEANGCVLVSDGKPMRFQSRKDALSFAIRRCYEHGATEGEPVINIEGSDGLWRAFDCRLLPLRNH